MNTPLFELIEKIKKGQPPEANLLAQVTVEFDFNFPADYIDFMKSSNGGEGFVGNNSYLSLWRVEDLSDWNKKYNVDLYAPGYFIFASDGGRTAYAFDKNKRLVVSFQFIGMLIADSPQILGADFTSFLEYLHKQ